MPTLERCIRVRVHQATRVNCSSGRCTILALGSIQVLDELRSRLWNAHIFARDASVRASTARNRQSRFEYPAIAFIGAAGGRSCSGCRNAALHARINWPPLPSTSTSPRPLFTHSPPLLPHHHIYISSSPSTRPPTTLRALAYNACALTSHHSPDMAGAPFHQTTYNIWQGLWRSTMFTSLLRWN